MNKRTGAAENHAAQKILDIIARSTTSMKRDDIIGEVRAKCKNSPPNVNRARTLLAEYEKAYGGTEAGRKWIALIGEAIPYPRLGKNWTVPSLGMVFIPVSSGSFQMGAREGQKDEMPVHTVVLSRDFWIGKYEVTQAEYGHLIATNPSTFKDSLNPVEGISWKAAVAFCAKLTDRERKAGHLPPEYEYRLPTEAEWEYAARGGGKSQDFDYSGSNDAMEVAWHEANSEKTHPVGGKRANELGLHDMSGNVWEWCGDWYASDYYGRSRTADPKGVASGSGRVFRGGGFSDFADVCCTTNRFSSGPSYANFFLGFRVVLAPHLQ